MRTSLETVVCVRVFGFLALLCRWKGGEIALDYRSVCFTTRESEGSSWRGPRAALPWLKVPGAGAVFPGSEKSHGGGDCHCSSELMLEAHTRKLRPILFFGKLFVCVWREFQQIEKITIGSKNSCLHPVEPQCALEQLVDLNRPFIQCGWWCLFKEVAGRLCSFSFLLVWFSVFGCGINKCGHSFRIELKWWPKTAPPVPEW